MRLALALAMLAACGRGRFDLRVDALADTPIDGAPEVHVFRDGLDGYAGTVDTYLDRGSPTLADFATPIFRWHDDTPLISMQHGLVRFTGVFGPGAIPVGSTVITATLQLVVIDSSIVPPGDVQEAAVDWDNAITWDTFGATPGVDPRDVGARVAEAPIDLGLHSIDVTASLRAWSVDPASNRGWLISPAPLNGDAVHVASSEAADPTTRPQLTVEFIRAP